MSKLDDIASALADIKAGLADHGTKLTEIGTDIDDLVAAAQSAVNDNPALQPILDQALDIKAAVLAEGDALTTLAAKHDTPPAEPPVEPPADGQ